MPMSPRLLRPRASGLVLPSDADARAYVLAVNTADGQPLEAPVVQAINAFITGCKADGIWSAIKASCILMGARTLSGALTPLVGSAPTNNGPFVSGDYNRKTGLVGNGSTKYLNTNRNNNSDPQNSMHAAFYVSAWGAGGSLPMSLFGAGATGTGSTVIVRSRTDTDGTVFFRNRSASTDPTGAGSTGLTVNAGVWAVSRSAAASFGFRSSGVSVSYTRTSEAPGSQPYFVFARSSADGTTAEQYASHRVAFYSIGESVAFDSLALLDTRITTLYNAIGAAIP